MLFLLLVLTWGITGAIVVDALHDDGWSRAVQLIGVGAAVVVSSVTAARAALRQRRVELAGPWPPVHPQTLAEVRAEREQSARKARRDRRLTAPAQLAGTFLAVVVIPCCVGWTLYLFVGSLRRYTGNDERFAVAHLDLWRAGRPPQAR